MSILIVDQAGTSGAAVRSDLSDVAAVVRGWCPDAPADIETAITDLHDALGRGDGQQAYELTTLLAVNIVDVAELTGHYEVNNSSHPERHSYWQRIERVTDGCDEASAEDYGCDWNCVVTLHLAPPEDGAAERWHMTAEHARTAQFRRVR